MKNIDGVKVIPLKKICDEREQICHDQLGVAVAAGKETLIEVFNGSAIQPEFEHCRSFLEKVQACGRLWRWLAVTLMPEEFQVLLADEDTDWPEARLPHSNLGSFKN